MGHEDRISLALLNKTAWLFGLPSLLAGCGGHPDGGSSGEPIHTDRQELANICGPTDDMQYVNAYNGTLGVSQAFVAANKGPVGVIKIDWEGRGTLLNHCTGTLVGTNLFLTADHCLDSSLLRVGLGAHVGFNYELSGGAGSLPRQEELFKILSVVDLGHYPQPGGLDFMLLRLEGDPGAKYGWAEIRESAPNTGSTITLIQHPEGDYKKVEVGHVLSSTGKPDPTNQLYYNDLDMMIGSSGGGLLDTNGHIVGINTNGECENPNVGWNWGVRITSALAMSSEVAQISQGTHYRERNNFCTHEGAQLFLGDFNGDNRDDLLCHDATGTKYTMLTSPAGQFCSNPGADPDTDLEVCNGHSTWFSEMGWCMHQGAQLFIGDVNGDGRDDMLCHDGSGNKWTSHATSSGTFTGTTWSSTTMAWCKETGDKLFLGDFNGDGRKDMFCYNPTGTKRIAFANSAGQFTGTNWSGLSGWCNTSGAKLLVGDFNGNGRDDLLCHKPSGNKEVVLSNSSPGFGTVWAGLSNWCTRIDDQLFVGDFNGDQRRDLLCHRSDGSKHISLATSLGRFNGTSWNAPMGWCYNLSPQLFVGSFNSDGRSDMLCHTPWPTNWPEKLIANARPDGSF